MMASAATSTSLGGPTAPPPPAAPLTSEQEAAEARERSFHHRMDQANYHVDLLKFTHHSKSSFLRQRQEEEEEGLARGANSAEDYRMMPPASETSGSNSGDDDERDLVEGGSNASGGGMKRMGGGHFNGLSSKKRRKQSKPLRLGAELEQAGESNVQGNTEPGEFHANSRYSDEYEYESGERRVNNEAPLNLSSMRDSNENLEDGEKPPLRILGPELLNPPSTSIGGFSQQIPTSMYQSMLPFGLPPFPFPFPNQSQASSIAGNKLPPSTSTGGRAQIFNPEAFCGLCNKEFCNKYFLKTHKANKHGIYSDSPGENTKGGNNGPPVSCSPGPNTPSSNSGAGARPESNGPPTPSSQAGSPFSGAFIAANMGSMRPPFLPISPGASPSPTAGQNLASSRQDVNANGGTMVRDAPSRDGSDHPQQSPQLTPQQKQGEIISPRDGEPNRSHFDDRASKVMDEDTRKSIDSPRSSISSLPSNFNNFNPMMFSGLPSLESFRREEDKQKEHNVPRSLPHIPNIPNIPGGGGTMGKGPFSADKLRQMGVINADAFCEICCKEFCNKYFLRVHKLKKHGICSPDLPPEKVQKILTQMAKEAGKTGNPPPPIIRPPLTTSSGSPNMEKAPLSGLSFGNSMLPPQLRAPGSMNINSALMQFPPLEPLLPQALKDLPSLPKLPDAAKKMEAKGKIEHEVIKIADDSNDNIKESSDLNANTEDKSDKNQANDLSKAQESPSASNESKPPASEDLQRLQSMIMELNSGKALLAMGNDGTSTVCKVCNKDMENKYFLRAHMMNEHGVLHMEDMTESQKQKEQVGKGSKNEGQSPDKLGPQFPLLNGNADIGAAADFASKFLQQMQKGLGANFSMDEGELSFLERVKSELTSSPKKNEKDPNRKPASLSRSYCEICKKELCNKYFMKTHMMKMHGINIEATGSSTPGSSSTPMNCHLCGKEMVSKYFLKVHLQTSHGVNEDGSPASPGIQGNGPGSGAGGGGGGGGLFGGLFPPPPEMLNMPVSSPDKDRYFSRLLGEQSELSRERLKELERQRDMLGNNTKVTSASKNETGHTCSLCGENFPEIVALQVHIIKSHGAFPPEKNSSLPLSDSKSIASYKSKDQESLDESARHDSQNEKERDSGKTDSNSNSINTMTPVTASNLPTTSSPPLSTPPHTTTSSMASKFPLPGLDPTAVKEAAKQFPHIEMLQRHMLSAQLPGLINPLLSGFPGFPAGNGQFPNPLQQLLSGVTPTKPGAEKDESTPPDAQKTEDMMQGDDSTAKATRTSKKKRFKCSKCQKKFPNRQVCLKHIQNSHGKKICKARKLNFTSSSPAKAARSQSRSYYVKQLMELLRVPTSRGTPQKQESDSSDDKVARHIMQPFLLKAPQKVLSPGSEDETHQSSPSSVNDEVRFVPSLVYLPVDKRVSQPLTVSFNLTPA